MRRIRRSLDKQSAITPVHALVSTRVDYCNLVIAAAPKTTTDKLPLPVSSAIPESLTAVSRSYYMMTYTGWTLLTELRSS